MYGFGRGISGFRNVGLIAYVDSVVRAEICNAIGTRFDERLS